MKKITLFPHQKRALEETNGKNKVAYYLDMGLGKTFVGSEKLNQLNADENVLVCQKSLMPMWINHLKTYYNFQVLDGSKPKELELINSLDRFVLIINYDLIFRRPEINQALKNYTLMLDESSLIQNDKSKRTKFILKMKPTNVILLSGTPTSGKYENLWSQAHMLGWEISKTLYNRTYINWETLYLGTMRVKTINKQNPYKKVDRLKRKFREHGAVFMKTEDVFDLPTQNFIPIKVKKSKKYRDFYSDKWVALNAHDELLGDTTLTHRLGLRQLCGMHSTAKLNALKGLIESTDDRLIIFYNFDAELAEMKKLTKKPISVVNGRIKDLTNYETEENSITFIQYQAGAMGLNLQKANKIVYFTPPEKSDLYEQSKKRIHRIGQDKPCFYYKMIVEGSIEEDIYDCLKERKDYTDELFKNNFK